MSGPYGTDPFPAGLRVFLFTACVVVTVAGLRLGATLLVPVALALFITVASLPLVNRLRSQGVPAGLAVMIVLLLDVSGLLVVLGLLVRSLTEIGAEIPAYAERLRDLEASVLGWLSGYGVDVGAIAYTEVIRYEHVVGVATAFLRGATDLAATVFLVVLVTVFLMAEATVFPAKVRAALGAHGASLAWLTVVLTEVQQYLALKTLVSALTGLLVGLAAWLLGVDFALLWGLLAFFLNFLPNVGSILAAAPAVLVALLQHGVGTALALAAVYVVVNVVLGNMVEPAIMGRRMGLSTSVVVLSMVFWGWAWGAVGMFLSVPLAMFVRIVLEHTSEYRWIAVLMAGGSGTKPAALPPRRPPAPDRADTYVPD
jgi:AI-2 transport protein TqsA